MCGADCGLFYRQYTGERNDTGRFPAAGRLRLGGFHGGGNCSLRDAGNCEGSRKRRGELLLSGSTKTAFRAV